ncbi:MAG: nucleoside hydrolase [Candidatus Paceibacterota bacterium]
MKTFLFLFSLLILSGCSGINHFTPSPIKEASPARVWIDMDPACGENLVYSDPDDCLAYVMARQVRMNIVGISTTSGNATESDTWYVANKIVGKDFPLYRGLGGCQSDAVQKLTVALRKGPMRIIALGPLTNIASLIRCDKNIAHAISEVVFVGSRFKEEVFVINPTWFIKMDLQDLNVAVDIGSVQEVIASGVPIRYIPFDAGKRVPITYQEILNTTAELPDYLHERLRGWGLMFSVLAGSDGFLPFDAVAVAYGLWPEQFECIPVDAQVVKGDLIVKLEAGSGGDSVRCIPKNASILKQYILSTIASP